MFFLSEWDKITPVHIQLKLGESILSCIVCFSFLLYPASASVSIPSQSPFPCPPSPQPGLFPWQPNLLWACTQCLFRCFLFPLLVLLCSAVASQRGAASLSVMSLRLFLFYFFFNASLFFSCLDVMWREKGIFCMRRWAMFVVLLSNRGCLCSFFQFLCLSCIFLSTFLLFFPSY